MARRAENRLNSIRFGKLLRSVKIHDQRFDLVAAAKQCTAIWTAKNNDESLAFTTVARTARLTKPIVVGPLRRGLHCARIALLTFRQSSTSTGARFVPQRSRVGTATPELAR